MTGQRYIDPDYVDVAERIRLFYEKYPDGRLLSVEQGVAKFDSGQEFIWVVAQAYRTPDDQQPAIGRAWEPIPGPTPFTKDSELMNAETAAWGRAIIAAGIPSKKIASADEVATRQPAPEKDGEADIRTKAQNAKLHALFSELEGVGPAPGDANTWKDYAKAYVLEQFGKHSSTELTKAECGKLIDHLEAMSVPFG